MSKIITVELRTELDSMKKLHRKQLEEKKKTEFEKMDMLLCDLLQEKDRELQQIVTQNLDQADSAQFLKGIYTQYYFVCFIFILKSILAKIVFLEHFIELSVVMAVTSNRLSIAKQLLDNYLITKNNFDEVSREDDAKSGMERGTVLMKALKATINRQPDLMTSFIKVLEKNEAFKSIAMKMGQEHSIEVTDKLTVKGITVSSTTTLDNTEPTDSSLLESMYTLQLYTC